MISQTNLSNLIYSLLSNVENNFLYYNNIMNILPKQYTQFKDKQYWDHFFSSLKNTENQFFEWYGSYSDYKSLLQKLISHDSNIFHVGCGKSTFSEDLLRDNSKLNIINCDYSKKVVQQMRKRAQQLKIKMEYTVCDLLQLLQQKYENKFNVVLDKGTLDAMLPEDVGQNVKKIKDFYFANMEKCLIKQKLDENNNEKKSSKFIIISLLQPFVLRTIIQYFGFKEEYCIDIYQCLIKDSKLQPFLVNVSLGKNQQKVIRYHPLGNIQTKKWKSKQQVTQSIHKIQQQISYGGRIKQLMPGRRTKFNIYNQNNRSMIRYVLQVSDSDDKQQLSKNNCSIFIVPQGKQNSYLFNDDEGIKKLQAQIKSSRIILVKLITGNQFQNLQKVKKQLNSIIPQFVQNGFDANKVPYLTDADQLGQRSYLFQNQQFIIDQVLIEQQPVRRLFLRSNPTTPQCQFKLTYLSQNANKHLKEVNSKILPPKKNMVIGIDRQQMYDSNAQFIFAGLKNLYGHPKQGWKVLILGCQFAFAKFLHDQFQTSQITLICGNRKSVQQVAHKYLQMPQSERLQILSTSPELYFTQNKQQKFNIIINCLNQINNSENPAKQYLSIKFQQQIVNHLEQPGIYVLHYSNYQIMPNLLQNFFPVYGSQSNPVTDNILFCLRYQKKYKIDKQENRLIVHQNLINLKAKSKPEYDWESDNFKDIIMIQPKVNKDSKYVFIDTQSQFQDIYAAIEEVSKDKKANKKKKKKK